MLFRELQPGQSIHAGPRRVTEAEIIEFATRYDPQFFHVDPERARASRWKGLIASGWMTCAIAMELAVRRVLVGSESIGSPGVEQVKWLNPLRPDDEVTLRMEVLEQRISRSGSTGVVRWRWVLTTQAAIPVLELVAVSLFDIGSVAGQPAA
jgi:acyl dehydratase